VTLLNQHCFELILMSDKKEAIHTLSKRSYLPPSILSHIPTSSTCLYKNLLTLRPLHAAYGTCFIGEMGSNDIGGNAAMVVCRYGE
jgi:hypothetical protein